MTGLYFLIPLGAIVVAYIFDVGLATDSKSEEQQIALPLGQVAAKRKVRASS
jgi:hypothetical protein